MRLNDYHKDFIRGYIRAALWSSSSSEPGYVEERDGYTEPTSLDDVKYGKKALSFSTIKRMRNNCVQFLNHTALSINAVLDRNGDLDFEVAGCDFWLTHNGHGAGFQDGDWPAPYARSLCIRRAHSKRLNSILVMTARFTVS